MRRNAQAGFSLVELMVAMVITLIVTGAIFGMLSGGQSSFKVQPERTDRQQNIRVAMDLILRDVAAAGVAMPAFIQTFTPGLNACVGCPDGGAPMGSSGAVTDEIEMLANTSGFDNEKVCGNPGFGNSTQVRLRRGTSNLAPNTQVLILMYDGTWTVRNVVDTSDNNTGQGDCTNGSHRALNVNAGAGDTSGHNTAGGVCQPSALGVGNAGSTTDPVATANACGGDSPCCSVMEVGFGGVIRYRIRNGADGVPNLERRVNGGAVEILARGIEDMQVQYVQSDAASPCTDVAPCPNAPAVTNPNYTTLITQVRITLSARTTAPGRIQGATVAVAGPDAIRGSLTSEVAPRQALWVLTQEGLPVPKWN
jgi:prepilin-type N-terminal cleavage/methylation domain-containing protein